MEEEPTMASSGRSTPAVSEFEARSKLAAPGWLQAIFGGGPGTGDRVIAYLFLVPSAILITLIVLYPFVVVVILSFYQKNLLSPTRLWVGLENYQAFFSDPDLANAVRNTIIWTVGSTSGELVSGLATALLLHQSLRFRSFSRAIVQFPYLVPTIVAVLIWKYMISDQVGVVNLTIENLGLVNQPLTLLGRPERALPTVIMVGVWKYFPFVVLTLLGILQSIPSERYEAAQVDGANWLQEFRYVTFPAILPVLLLVALLRTIWNWDKFDIIYQLTGGGPVQATTTMSVFVYQDAFVKYSEGGAAAVAIVMFFIVLSFSLIYSALYDQAERAQ